MINEKYIGSDIIKILIDNGHSDLADDLKHWLLLLKNGKDADKEIAKDEIIKRCNIRWLGDLYILELSQLEWWRKLERLAMKVKRYT